MPSNKEEIKTNEQLQAAFDQLETENNKRDDKYWDEVDKAADRHDYLMSLWDTVK